MRRLAAITLLLVGAAALAIFGTGAGDDGNYQVRAIFDNAAFVIKGEDVKIAGVKVGKVGGLDIVDRKKAGITLDISDNGFQDFRTDAHCTIRPQSLIGEKYVECTPTAPHPPGQPLPPPLPTIKSGAHKGEHLLPVKNTSSPVDIDEINDILRQPNANRLAIIINEFGTGLAGNGKNLSEAIYRANPALQATDQVLNILANQNKVLADLARESDAVLAPLAAQRQRVADFVVKANTVNEAVAERRGALQENLRLLPRFLQELRPTLQRVGSLSDETTPVLADLQAEAPSINRFIIQLGPFSQAARPAVRTLGRAAQAGTPAVRELKPIADELNAFGRAAAPTASNLDKLLTSLKSTGGVEAILDYAFHQVTAVNGFDSISHYLRIAQVVNTCSLYAVAPVEGCSANFTTGENPPSSESASAASTRGSRREQAIAAGGDDPLLQRVARVLTGEKPQQVLADEARAKVEARAKQEERARRAQALRREKAATAREARAKATERRAVLGARKACHDAHSAAAKARCARARHRAKTLAKRRQRLDRHRVELHQNTPITLPTVALPGGLGQQQQVPAPAPPSATPLAADPLAAPAQPTSPDAQPAQGGEGQGDQAGATSDPNQGLFDYLLGN
jgi:phospholipid/cholesterol/gamma-HCH transport system substrate-binding protein